MKKFFNTLKLIFTWIVVIISVAMMVFTVFSVTMVDKNDRNLFGYRIYKVMSDSMSATDFSAGDLVLVKEVDPSTLGEGDIIAFISTNSESFGEVLTHKIRSKVQTGDGLAAFETYGTTTGVSDENSVTYSYILGKYVGNIPKLGYFFNFIKTTPGYLLCIFTPFAILILIQALDSIKLFKQYKAEQNKEIQDEREALAKEREATEKMMLELMELKAKLEAKERSESNQGSDSES